MRRLRALTPAAGLLSVLVSACVADAADFELIGLTADNTLLRFDSSRPGEAVTVKAARVSGTLVGIDFRPADRRLYGLTSANDLYVIDPDTGAAKRVGTLTTGFEGGARAGFDFNPQSDRLRLVAHSGQNLRVHPDLGAAATDGPLHYAAKDRNRGRRAAVTAVAYTRSLPKTPATRTFGIDSALDLLVLQDPPNDGTLHTVGALGIDFGDRGGFDILTDARGGEHAFAVSGSHFYGIDLATGKATPLGTVGGGTFDLIGLTVDPAGH